MRIVGRLKPWIHTAAGEVIYNYVSLVTRTARFHLEGQENLQTAQRSGRPILWSLWHQQGLLWLSYGLRHVEPSQYVLIVVGDVRGNTFARMGERFGAHDIYGVDMAGNPVAAGRSVLKAVRAMRDGYHSMLAPDGPDGPAFQPKKGIAVLARKAGATVLPFGCFCHQAYQMNRWDRYMIPYPFCHLHCVIGEPIEASSFPGDDELRSHIAQALHTVRDRAHELAQAER